MQCSRPTHRYHPFSATTLKNYFLCHAQIFYRIFSVATKCVESATLPETQPQRFPLASHAHPMKGSLTSQTKGLLTLFCSAGLGVASSLATSRFDQPTDSWKAPAFVGGVCFILLFVLALTKSREEVELAEFKRIQSDENERDAAKIEIETRTANATAERILNAIESGNFEEAERWKNFQKDQHGK